ncbi:MAG: glucosamine-6-phosphate deaminase [Candidatus Neomarinimicrobiota bacterium]|nr:MAG: glucosamine-6-phosphate deaminase [Candidatus Neomarinimicrobiota bacterium]
MLVIVEKEYADMCRVAAKMVVDRLRKKPNLVLGLATGSTPVGLYQELIRYHREDGLDFSKVVTFNLDEYIGLPPHHEQSYATFMKTQLFDHINISPENIHIPQGMFGEVNITAFETDPAVTAFCHWYEDEIKRAGGIDIQILGIGGNGHIAFNEPGSSLGSRTRVKTLTEKTRRDNARFFASIDEVPRYAITMGIGTIMEAREVLLLANGEGKAEAVRRSIEGPVTAMCPASMLQMHRKSTIILDQGAASKLSAEFITYG